MSVFDLGPAPATGQPGAHLSGDFGARGQYGALGERAFSAALARSTASIYASWTSIRVPGLHSADVDCVVASGSRVVLVDVKRWKTGDGALERIFWSLPAGRNSQGLMTYKAFRGLKPYSLASKEGAPDSSLLSNNMGNALDLFRRALPAEIDVSAMVVFVPAPRKGIASADLPQQLPQVRLLRWAGGIESFRIGQSFFELGERLGPPSPPLPSIESLLFRHQISLPR